MEPAWSFEALQAWFGPRVGQDVLETDLLREFFPGLEPFAGGLDLDLFHKHFLLFRRLWVFDDEVRAATGRRLWIRGIRVTLLEAPAPGTCGWLDPATGRYCGREMLCPHHDPAYPEVNGVKAYYLDWDNLTWMTDQGLRTMIDGFFRWMGNQEAVDRALGVLGLPTDATPAAIKARWRKLSLEHHPDRGGDPELYQTFSAAWTALKDRASEPKPGL